MMEDNEVKLKGVRGLDADQLAGSLKNYTKRYTPLKEIRDKIQNKIAKEISET